jgi:hypothetical protein
VSLQGRPIEVNLTAALQSDGCNRETRRLAAEIDMVLEGWPRRQGAILMVGGREFYETLVVMREIVTEASQDGWTPSTYQSILRGREMINLDAQIPDDETANRLQRVKYALLSMQIAVSKAALATAAETAALTKKLEASVDRPAPVAMRLTSVAVCLVPQPQRTRYQEEFASELWDLAKHRKSRSAQLLHAFRLLSRVLNLRVALTGAFFRRAAGQ